jgi:uncharacterized protein (UPF0332 family)
MKFDQNWAEISLHSFLSAKILYDAGEYRSSTACAYYAAYQAGTSACYAHGDEAQFPHNWNNPTHDQLPDLIRNNGDLDVSDRRRINKMLHELRHIREDAQYRPGISVTKDIALGCIRQASDILALLQIPMKEEN